MGATGSDGRRVDLSRSVRRVVAAGVTALALIATGLSAAPYAAGIVPGPPKAPKTAPRIVEGFTPYLPQVSCDPTAKPGTSALRSKLMRTYGGRDLGISRACRVGARSEHKEGRAWDWGLRASNKSEKARATAFLKWLVAKRHGRPGYQARRLGVMYVIYNHRIWSAYRASEGWRKYPGGEGHGDHIHISLAWNGAMKRTSWWTGKRTTTDYGPCVRISGWPAPRYSGKRTRPCPRPVSPMSLRGTPLLHKGMKSPYVLQLQRRLHVRPVTGYFGSLTKSRLTSYQRGHHLKVTGTTTRATWRALRAGAASPRLPARMAYRVKRGDTLSEIAALWRSTVPAIRVANRLRSDRVAVGRVLRVPVRSSLTKYTYTRLRPGSRSAAVKALQTALRMRAEYCTGYYGPVTKSRVRALERRHRWKADGITDPRVWRALGA